MTPVPETIGFEPDASYIGAPFYVMEFVTGHVLRDPLVASRVLDGLAMQRIGDSVVEALRALHTVDPDTVGLGDLGRKHDYIDRQLRAWGRQLESVNTSPRVGSLLQVRDRLSRDIPRQQRYSVVHGYYRLDNVVASTAGDVNAILDWELWTLGDPLADVATLAMYWRDPDDQFLPLETATVAQGFPRRNRIVGSYQRRSKLDFSRFAYYMAFASWRLAVMGVLLRYNSGAYGGAVDGGRAHLQDAVPRLGRAASDLLDEDRG